MSNIDLKEWPEFRKECSKLGESIPVMLGKMDSVMADETLNDGDKATRIESLLNTYLPK